MMRTGTALWLVVTGMFLTPGVQAGPPPIAETEINYLLTEVANSHCEFNRNGSWYDAKSAAAHLSSKLQYLLAKDLIQSSEDFIDKAATLSGLSGHANEIRCNSGEAVPTAQWLRVLLARYRQSVELQVKVQ